MWACPFKGHPFDIVTLTELGSGTQEILSGE